MSKFTKLDTMLISEAYSAQLLSESAPYMTIAEIQSKLPTMTIAEAQIIEEMFGKMGKRLGQIGAGIGNLAGAAGRGLKSAGQAVGSTAGKVGSGIASAAGQVGSNVKNMYQTGADSKEAEQAVTQAQQAIEDLINLIDTAKAKYGPGSTFNKYFSDDPMKMTLQTISNQLNMASQTAQDINTDVKDRGFFGGSKAAYSAAKQGMSAPQGAPVVP
jgi:hypothetical protein